MSDFGNTPIRRMHTLAQGMPKAQASRTRAFNRSLLSKLICAPLDRIGELGDNEAYGHTGCVNAVSWAQEGGLLLSGSDDKTVRMWRVDPSSTESDYPLVNTSVIQTGHTSNIFAAQMLPYSTRIASCARDATVRVSDIGHGLLAGNERSTRYGTSNANVAVFRCHAEATKRVLLQDSPDTFLTVAEDGRVRQHDLRARPHNCRRGGHSAYASQNPDIDACGPPLIRLPHELHSISSSPLAPHQFVVGGEGSYGFLFDRRQTGRVVREEWGMPVDSENLTTCVRRFGRPSKGRKSKRGEHITGVRMARSNPHEVILSYSRDAVYLYSTLDDPTDPATLLSRSSSVLPSSAEPRVINGSSSRTRSPSTPVIIAPDDAMDRPPTVKHEEPRSFPTADSSTGSLGGAVQATHSQTQDTNTRASRPDDDEYVLGLDNEEDNGDDSETLMEELLILDQGDSEMAGDEDDAEEEEDDDQEEIDRGDWIEEGDDDDMDQGQEEFDEPVYGGTPMVLPRARFSGAANVQTIKDVNFLGPNDELVVSGSDDGNMFIWNKHTSRVHGIYEGDGSVVNVIEGHPSLPLVGVSGIDNTVKIFGPRRGRDSLYDRLPDADAITSQNEATSRRQVETVTRAELMQLLAAHYRFGGNVGEENEGGEGGPGCVNQ